MAHARRGPAIAAAMLLLSACGGRAEADFGYGFGFGMGFHNPQPDVDFINSWSLQRGAAAAANRPRALTAPARSRSRDEGFMERYDLATREAMVNRIARNPRQQMSTVNPGGLRPGARPDVPPAPPILREPQAAPAAPVPRAVLLGNFFDRGRRLAWPADAPATGDLARLRGAADRAILSVLDELDAGGSAHPSNVTHARDLLLDYGRPALEYAREHSTPAMADSFHAFLLSLYSNLGLAATAGRAP